MDKKKKKTHTHHIDPSPAVCVPPAVPPFGHHYSGDDRDPRDGTAEDPNDGPTDALTSFSLETPKPKLSKCEGAHDDGVGGKGKIIEANGGFGRSWITRGILISYQWRIQKRGGRHQITDETEQVDRPEIDRQPGRGSTAPVGYRLRVEGGAPAEKAERGSE